MAITEHAVTQRGVDKARFYYTAATSSSTHTSRSPKETGGGGGFVDDSRQLNKIVTLCCKRVSRETETNIPKDP